MTNTHSDIEINSSEYAERLDEQDPLKHLRNEFIIPTKTDLKSKTLVKSGNLPPPPAATMQTDRWDSFYE